MMDWKEKMQQGIKLIQEAYIEDSPWKDCHDCPFYTCCEALRNAGVVTPDNWKE